MRGTLQGLIAVIALQAAALATDDASTKVIDRDPTTMMELHRVVEEAAGKGATRVRFPSGEWNWHDTTRIEIPQKDKWSKWEAKAASFEEKALGQWLLDNKVAAVQLMLGNEVDPKTYFTIEKMLRDRKIPYGLIKNADTGKLPHDAITLYETHGKARVLPLPEPKSNK